MIQSGKFLSNGSGTFDLFIRNQKEKVEMLSMPTATPRTAFG
jgi:hypothetical protein